jgi:hypothetical protein
MSGVDKSKQPLAAIMHNPLAFSPSGGGDKGSTEKLAKSFSETSLKSNESLISNSSVGPEKNPRVPKRPPLLVSNQKYATILNQFETGGASSDLSIKKAGGPIVQEPLEPVLKKKPTVGGPPPPRPSKPAELRGVKSPTHSTASFSGADLTAAVNAPNVTPQPPASVTPKPVIPTRPNYTPEPQKPTPPPSLAPRPIVQTQPAVVQSTSIPPPSLAPRPTGGATTTTSIYQPKIIDVSLLAPDCLRRYLELFKEKDTDNDGFLSGEEVKNIWLRSGLDTQSLGQVWSLSDLTDDGLLDSREFCIGNLQSILPHFPYTVVSHDAH